MIDFQTLSSILTVVAATTFAVILAWTLAPKQRARFDAAANLPFDLPDDAAGDATADAATAAAGQSQSKDRK